MDPLANLFGPLLDPQGSSSDDDDKYITTVYSHLLGESDSDEDVFLTRAAALNRDRAAAHQRLYQHYFAEDCVYDGDAFKRPYFRLCFLFFINYFGIITYN